MIVVRPITVTDAVYTGGNLVESDAIDGCAVWSAVTAYTPGQRARLVSTHMIYECVVANTNYSPDVNLTGVAPKWQEVKATNKWAPFDEQNAIQASNADSVQIELTPGLIDSCALINLSGVEAVCRRIVDSVTVFEETKSLQLDNVDDWYDYFTEDIVGITDVLFDGIPAYGTGTLEIEVNSPGGTAKVGEVVVGSSADIGEIQWQPKVRRKDYSRTETDDYGQTVFVRRRNAKVLQCVLFVENSAFDEVNRIMGTLTATPCVWVGDESYTSTFIYGWFVDFEGVIDSPGGSFCNLEIQGLT